MGYFAKVVDGVVENVVVADQAHIDTLEDKDLYVETSTDGSKTVNFASKGDKHRPELNGFEPANKPFESWVLDEATCQFKAPKVMPKTQGKNYRWDEGKVKWVATVSLSDDTIDPNAEVVAQEDVKI